MPGGEAGDDAVPERAVDVVRADGEPGLEQRQYGAGRGQRRRGAAGVAQCAEPPDGLRDADRRGVGDGRCAGRQVRRGGRRRLLDHAGVPGGGQCGAQPLVVGEHGGLEALLGVEGERQCGAQRVEVPGRDGAAGRRRQAGEQRPGPPVARAGGTLAGQDGEGQGRAGGRGAAGLGVHGGGEGDDVTGQPLGVRVPGGVVGGLPGLELAARGVGVGAGGGGVQAGQPGAVGAGQRPELLVPDDLPGHVPGLRRGQRGQGERAAGVVAEHPGDGVQQDVVRRGGAVGGELDVRVGRLYLRPLGRQGEVEGGGLQPGEQARVGRQRPGRLRHVEVQPAVDDRPAPADLYPQVAGAVLGAAGGRVRRRVHEHGGGHGLQGEDRAGRQKGHGEVLDDPAARVGQVGMRGVRQRQVDGVGADLGLRCGGRQVEHLDGEPVEVGGEGSTGDGGAAGGVEADDNERHGTHLQTRSGSGTLTSCWSTALSRACGSTGRACTSLRMYSCSPCSTLLASSTLRPCATRRLSSRV